MSRSKRARWLNACLLAFGGLLPVLTGAMKASPTAWDLGDWAWVVVLFGGALWLSPLGARPTVGHRQAQLAAADGRTVVYTRPGCTFCGMLRLGLTPGLLSGGAEPVWVDIWEDEAAAAFVREVNGGNETVPTVIIDREPVTNPPVSAVRASLKAA